MALRQIGLGLIGDMLEGARPLLQRGGGEGKQLQRAATHADSQAIIPRDRPGAAFEVQLAVGVAQVARLKATPMWRFDGGGYQCADAETQVSIWFAHGPHHTLTLPPRARVVIAAGMLHFPA